ncbi:AMP-binding protein [Aquisalimonas asiatica]|uniref:Long-chain-fatty-acid--CoA ligase n=1 Tax=Aquisalimonas asiatica TaxID=406100 RepID=A0A1H8U133_9GAMM|nr:AMP-binding protein [Aquisalimonas asiatica]SEO96970.1 long-chain acyl-CoA synthetase [Aquisalimonas asiatica]
MNETTQDAKAAYDNQPWLASYGEGVDKEITPLPDRNIADLARRIANDNGDRTAFVTCLDNGLHGSLSFRDTDTLSDQFAAYLRFELGLEPGDRVAVQMPNCLSYPVAVFGIFKAGLVLVNVNPLYTPRETNHQLKDSGAKALLVFNLFGNNLKDAMDGTDVRHVIMAGAAEFFPLPRRLLINTVMKLKKMIPEPTAPSTPISQALATGKAHVGKLEKPVKRAPEDLAVLQYTGGTTGPAKGAMLTHGNLLANLAQTQTVSAPVITPGKETVLTALPLYHIFAFTNNLMGFYYNGCRNVLCPSPRPPSNLRKAFEKFEITQFAGVNVLFHALANEDWFKNNPPPLRQTVSGGTALHGSVAEEWKNLVGIVPVEGYGLSETSPVVSVNQPSGEIRLGTIGLPVPSTIVRIIDEDWNPVPPGEVGELAVKGPQVFQGYWNKPDETDAVLQDGFFRTGDMARMEDGGFFRIVDRKKDMIDVSGFNVYPNEVEEVLSEHPDIDEAAVIGIPNDEAGGEIVRAYVVTSNKSLKPEDVIEFARKNLTGYKVPKEVHFADDLPKTAVGKILRKDLRNEALKNNG